MIKGSCLCGNVEFEVEERPGKIFNCHCSICRKAHGAAFATQVFAMGETLKIIKGDEFLKDYNSGRGYRAFCSNCGSRLMNYAEDKSLYLSVALSSIDSDFNGRPVAHVLVDSKADWVEPSADIPAYEGIPREIWID